MNSILGVFILRQCLCIQVLTLARDDSIMDLVEVSSSSLSGLNPLLTE